MKYRAGLAFGLIATLGACNHQAVTSNQATPLGPGAVLAGGSYTSGGGITVATKLRDIGGLTGICGAWSESTAQSIATKKSAGRILQSGAVYLEGKKLHQNLVFMRQVSPLTDYSGAEVNCIRTKRPWQSGDESRRLKVRIPSQMAYNDRSGGSGSVIIMFNETGPGALGRSLAVVGVDPRDIENKYLSRSPTVIGGKYSTGGGITVAAELQDIEGITFVCGAWKESKTQSELTKGYASRILSTGVVQMSGRTVIKDLRYMQNSRSKGRIGRSPASCTSTGLPWNAAYAAQPLAISVPRQLVRTVNGQDIYFEPGGPGA